MSRRRVRPAASTCSNSVRLPGETSVITPTRRAFGRSSFTNSMRLPAISGMKPIKPVTLPPGLPLDPAASLGIAAHRHDDRDGLRRPKGRVDGVATHRHDHVDIRSHKVRSQCRESLRIALRTANLNQNVLAYRPAKLAEHDPQCFG